MNETAALALSPALLGHSCFTVRSSCGQVIASCATCVPVWGVGVLETVLGEAKALAMLVLEDLHDSASTPPSSGASSRGRMANMYHFHGLALLISTLLKVRGHAMSHDPNFITNHSLHFQQSQTASQGTYPTHLVLAVFTFGLDLLREDPSSCQISQRSTLCSLVRAGGLITSSCMNAGYKVVKPMVLGLLIACDMLFKATQACPMAGEGASLALSAKSATTDSIGSDDPPATASTTTFESDDTLLFELMTVEAALVAISSLLWLCPEALLEEDHCLGLVISGLELAFKALKTKYQPKYKSHFRFRTLHAILLECFAWLPSGSFPNCCQPIFVEALRVFRDCVAGGTGCTLIQQYILPDQIMLHPASYPLSNPDGPPTANDGPMQCMLRLERYAVCLQKKECEASLACFGRGGMRGGGSVDDAHYPSNYLQPPDPADFEQAYPSPPLPVVEVDTRTVNAAIQALSATFIHQSPEYQAKAIILCSQAVEQFIYIPDKSYLQSSIFGEGEEKRKREKKANAAALNVSAAFSAIVESFPTHHGALLENDLSWGQLLVDTLFELVSSQCCDVRIASCNALASFAAKVSVSVV